MYSKATSSEPSGLEQGMHAAEPVLRMNAERREGSGEVRARNNTGGMPDESELGGCRYNGYQGARRK